MAVPRRRSGFVASRRRTTQWFGIDLSATIVADASTQIGSLNAAALLARPFTVMRTRLWYHVESDQTAASEVATGALGMIVANDQAVAAGSGSIPDPVASSDAPFFVWEPFTNSFILGDATGFVEPGGTDIVVDSKAMRKVGANEDVSVIIEETNGVGINVFLTGRMLVALH